MTSAHKQTIGHQDQTRLDGRTAVVTGAAGGIGRAICGLLSRRGARILALDLNKEALDGLVDALCADGGQATGQAIDVRSERDWQRFENTVCEEFGGFHIMVGNAAIFDYRKIEETALEQWTELVRTNLDGIFLATRTAIRVMKKTPLLDEAAHSIVNICSIAGNIGAAFASAYHMTKGGLRLFTKSAALECGYLKYPIRVNSVHPGLTETTMKGRLMSERARILGVSEAAVEEEMVKSYPLGRFAKPHDVAEAVSYLASPASEYATGSELFVDGGFTAR